MSVSASALIQGSGHLLLRWSDTSISHEEFVEVVTRQPTKIVVRSVFEVAENTRVYLTGTQYSVDGVARTCQKDANSFLVVIEVEQESSVQTRFDWDPGIIAVESFLTEEQEAEILASLDAGTPGPAVFISGY
jgi:hypothetical protein